MTIATGLSRRSPFLLLAFLVEFLSVSGTASGQEIEGLHGGAVEAIEEQVHATGLRYPQASIFYGDLSGRGANDAISFVYHDSGGSAPQLTTWIWYEADGAYTLLRTVSTDEVFGLDPRNVEFSLGRIEVTTTVPKGGDPHCCPTGERTFMIDAGAGSVAGRPISAAQSAAQVLDVPFADSGGDGQAAWCASSIVAGLNPNGDGFLAVRTGPGTQFRKIDEVHNGDVVATCDSRGAWVAIVYGPSKAKGWVHGKWLKDRAG